MYHFLKNSDKTTLQAAFPFIKISNIDELDKQITDYSSSGLSAYLINEKSVSEFKDPFVLIKDLGAVRDNNDDIIVQVSIGNITVTKDTLVAWF